MANLLTLVSCVWLACWSLVAFRTQSCCCLSLGILALVITLAWLGQAGFAFLAPLGTLQGCGQSWLGHVEFLDPTGQDQQGCVDTTLGCVDTPWSGQSWLGHVEFLDPTGNSLDRWKGVDILTSLDTL